MTEQETSQDTISRDELIAFNDSRIRTYQLLNRLYRKEIDLDYAMALRQGRFPVSTGNELVDEGYRLIAKYLSTHIVDQCVSDLAIDFVHCFVGSGMDAFSCAYPYESVYTSQKRLMLQETRDEVLATMRRMGLGKAESCKETEDHIAMELELMGIMAQRASDALRAGDEDLAIQLFEDQAEFLSDHLNAWTPMFTKDLRKFAQTDFYQGLACLTDGFLASEAEFLNDLLSDDEETEVA